MACKNFLFLIEGTVILLLLRQTSWAQPAQRDYVVTLGDRGGQELFKQPGGRYAVMVFYEHALGNYCGVIYYDNMGLPEDGNWRLEDRFWQDRTWASDVTGFCWSPSGRYLYISTAEVYGDGGLFRLDLLHRKSKLLFPTKSDPFYTLAKKHGVMTEIQNLDSTDHRLRFTATLIDDSSKQVSREIEIK
jgi:hypothetical protein